MQCPWSKSYDPPKPTGTLAVSSDQLHEWRKVGDPPADKIYAIIKEELHDAPFDCDYDIVEDIINRAATEEKEGIVGPFTEFYKLVSELPDWYDHKTVEDAKYFYTTVGFPGGAVALTSAALVSSYGAGNGSQVLTETGRLKDDVVRRIFETGDFIHKVMKPDSLLPGGPGWRVILQVRMLHCAIRRYLMNRNIFWDEEKLGHPINQEDLSGTLCLFVPVLIESLRKLHFRITEKDCENYHLLWRSVGYLIGIQEELLPKNYQETVDLAYLIQQRQWHPTDSSRLLVQSLFESLHFRPTYFFMPSTFWQTMSRYLLGEERADRLGLAPMTPVWGMVVEGFRMGMWTNWLMQEYLPFFQAGMYWFNKLFYDFFMWMGLGGRSVDYKMKRY